MPVTNQWKPKDATSTKLAGPSDQELSKGTAEKTDINKPAGKTPVKLPLEDPKVIGISGKGSVGVKTNQFGSRVGQTVPDGTKTSPAQKSPEPAIGTEDKNSPTEEEQLSPGRTKGLAGFWSNQNDEVKNVKKKRFDTSLADDTATPMVVENTPKRLEGVVRAEDPGEWQKPIEVEGGSTKNKASSFQKLQTQGKNISKLPDSEPILRVKTKDLAGKITQQLNEPMKPKKKKVPTATLR